MRQRLYFAEARTAAAIVCATIAVLIVLSEDHFHISLRSPSTFHIMIWHKCGKLLLLCLGWLALETAHLTYRWFVPVEAPNRVRHAQQIG